MDLTYFGLQRRPFPAAPDSTCYYPATGHEHALARLRDALVDGEAMLLLSGDAGTGKTLLCHCLLERFYVGAAIAFLTNSHIGTRRDLIQAVLYDLGQPHESGTEQELRLRLTDYLLKNFAQGRKTLVVADEAHYLSVDALEELRLLCNLEAGGSKAVQVVLVAQPSMARVLNKPELASLRQRLALRVRLPNLGVEEAIDYLLHHLRAAGGHPEALITEEALELIARGTRGVPRLLNQAAHQAMALAFELQTEVVDAEITLEVLSALGLSNPDVDEDAAAAPVTAPAYKGDPATGLPQLAQEVSTITGSAFRLPADQAASGDGNHEVLAYRLYDPPRQPA
jgi:type II secretory pathway predicted ATPase ExeA